MSILFTHDADASKKKDRDSYIECGLNRLKPHFINNALSTIYYLCDMEPKKAQSLTSSFSDYLLNVLEAMHGGELVPFAKELEFTEAYLALEEIRFEDRLSSDIDIDVTDFLVPPMSLQIPVEIAVKHGISESERSGTVRILTRRLPDNKVKLSIIDDGVGFDNKDRDHPSYLELLEVSERIAKEAGGEMTIESSAENGTSVEIILTSIDKEN